MKAKVLASVMSVALVGCVTMDEEGLEVGEREAALVAGGLYPDMGQQVPSHMQIQNTQQGESMRFSSALYNLGDGPLQIRRGGGTIGPCDVDGVHYAQCENATQEILDGVGGNVVATQPAGLAVFHPEHNHWHQDRVTRFTVRSGSPTGTIVGMTGIKITFCMIDFEILDSQSPRTRVYNSCNADLQGVSVGFADQYHHSTEGQEVNMTGVPQGEYYFVNEADPDNKWAETNDTNNSSWVRFFLDRSSGANPNIVELEHSPCIEGFTCAEGPNK
jgi:hypothetical protein